MEMTTYAKYRILLFSLELTDGKFLRVDNLEDGCSAIEAKAVFDEMRRTADVVDVGEARVIACRSFRKSTRSNAEESLANAEGFPCKAARRALARLEGWESGIPKSPRPAARRPVCGQT